MNLSSKATIVLFKYANFGGFVRLGPKTIPVTGRTLRKIAEFESYWISLGIPWKKTLLNLLRKAPHLATEDFVNKWMIAFRKSFFSKAAILKFRLSSESILGLRFEIWQCCRDQYSLEEIDDFLDAMTREELIRFSEDIDQKIDLAGGSSSDGNLSEILRLLPKQSGANPDHTTESMIATLIKHKMIGSPSDILDSTPSQISGMLTDPDKLEDDLMLETMVPENGPEAKRNLRLYQETSKELLASFIKVSPANVDVNNASAVH